MFQGIRLLRYSHLQSNCKNLFHPRSCLFYLLRCVMVHFRKGEIQWKQEIFAHSLSILYHSLSNVSYSLFSLKRKSEHMISQRTTHNLLKKRSRCDFAEMKESRIATPDMPTRAYKFPRANILEACKECVKLVSKKLHLETWKDWKHDKATKGQKEGTTKDKNKTDSTSPVLETQIQAAFSCVGPRERLSTDQTFEDTFQHRECLASSTASQRAVAVKWQ